MKVLDQRAQLIAALAGEGAHIEFDSVVRNFPVSLRGQRPGALPRSAWDLLEHMRIAQADILDFCVNPNYKELEWPDDYWPKEPSPPEESAWDSSIRAFRRDLKAMQELVGDARRDLFEPIPHGTGQTLFRETLLVIDHNSYHLGQMVQVRQLLGAWPSKK